MHTCMLVDTIQIRLELRGLWRALGGSVVLHPASYNELYSLSVLLPLLHFNKPSPIFLS